MGAVLGMAAPAIADHHEGDKKKKDSDSAASAAKPAQPKGAEAILKALDRNNDGKLQQIEIDMAVVVLRRMDRNENGEIEADEMVALPPRPSGGGGDRVRPGGGDRRRDFRMPSIADLDKDGDGKLSKEEVPERMQQRFDQIDGNSDGFIDKAEMDQLIANIRRRFQQAGQRPGQPGQQRRRPDPNAGQGGADKPKRPALEDE